MIKKTNLIFKSEFARNVAILTTGTTMAQAIPVAISPILTRLYTPDDFGVLALFLAITTICSVVANGKYEMAIMVPEKNDDALNILYLSVLIAMVFSILLFILIVLFDDLIVEKLNEERIRPWLFFIPISVFFLGLFNALNIYCIRQKNFKEIAVSKVYKSLGMGVTQVGFGLIKSGVFGLILGQIISYLSGNYILLKQVLKQHSIKETFRLPTIRLMAKKYNRFPKYSLPGNLMNALTLNTISFLISGIYSLSILGFYTMANRMVGVPSALIGRSISQVYFQKMSATKNSGGNVKKLFISTLKKLVFVSFPIYFIAFFLVEPIFPLIFGEEWRLAGKYAAIVVPLLFIRFISSSLSNTLNIFEKQHLVLILNFILFIILISVFGYAKINTLEFEAALELLVIGNFFQYSLALYIYYHITCNYLISSNK